MKRDWLIPVLISIAIHLALSRIDIPSREGKIRPPSLPTRPITLNIVTGKSVQIASAQFTAEVSTPHPARISSVRVEAKIRRTPRPPKRRSKLGRLSPSKKAARSRKGPPVKRPSNPPHHDDRAAAVSRPESPEEDPNRGTKERLFSSKGRSAPEEVSRVSAESGPKAASSQKRAAPAALKRAPVISLPRYDSNPKPYYPPLARRRGYEGTTLLRVEVSETGEVTRVEIAESSGYAVLDRASVRAVRRWRFTPGRRDGRPERMWVRIPVTFRLKGSP